MSGLNPPIRQEAFGSHSILSSCTLSKYLIVNLLINALTQVWGYATNGPNPDLPEHNRQKQNAWRTCAESFSHSSKTAPQADPHPRNPRLPRFRGNFIFSETLRIFFCSEKQMIAALKMGGRGSARTRALATVDSTGTTV
jgi:hypothetical protein